MGNKEKQNKGITRAEKINFNLNHRAEVTTEGRGKGDPQKGKGMPGCGGGIFW